MTFIPGLFCRDDRFPLAEVQNENLFTEIHSKGLKTISEWIHRIQTKIDTVLCDFEQPKTVFSLFMRPDVPGKITEKLYDDLRMEVLTIEETLSRLRTQWTCFCYYSLTQDASEHEAILIDAQECIRDQLTDCLVRIEEYKRQMPQPENRGS